MDSFRNKRAKLHSEKQRFFFHDDCFICGKNVDKDLAKRLPGNPDYQYSTVMTISLIETVADDDVNADEAKAVGDKILESMVSYIIL